jgi:glycosyltransferase involved in cell wall biosynthesis
MKICVISTPIFKLPLAGYSGLEHLAWLTAKGLAEKGHEVSLVAPDGSECPNVEIVPIGPERQVDEHMAYGGYPEVKEGEEIRRKKHGGYWQHLLKQDCVIDHSWMKFSYILKMEERLTAPTLGILHAPVNSMYQSLPQVEKPCFVCISKDQALHFEAIFSRPARVAYNGIDTDHYKPIKMKRTKRFLFLARFSSIKGPDLSVEAAKAADVELDLVGDASLTGEPALLDKVKSMCNGNGIKMIGHVSRTETVWWYSQAHCLLHPNQRFREPFGLAPVESQSCGTPVICWNLGAMRETVKHGETGWLVDSMSELVKTVKNAKEDGFVTKEMREACRENSQKFTIEKMISRYDELIKEAVDGGGW